ncbi:MAG TPA: hypothetical protein VJR04_00275 [Terriglobales bacterium]|nr:hypothetical protein [Terriglobales bacterium]
MTRLAALPNYVAKQVAFSGVYERMGGENLRQGRQCASGREYDSGTYDSAAAALRILDD